MAQKIGVYFDKSNIGAGLDLDALGEVVSSKFADSCAVVKEFPIMAAESARKEIVQDIEENELDGVLLVGSSPRVDWDLYKFSGVQVERVNLREQCVLAYGATVEVDEDAEADEELFNIASDYVRMGFVKLLKQTPPDGHAVESTRTILVVGGGWTGLTAAANASRSGYDVVLVEKTGALGGKAATMLKTVPLKYPYTTAQETGIEAKIAAVTNDARITVLTSAQVTKLSGMPGEFVATITGANGAEEYKIGSVVLASGWQPMNPEVMAPMGYGTLENVVTAAEFEKMAKAGTIGAKRVAFVLNTRLIDGGDIYAKVEEPEAAPEKIEEGEDEKFHQKDLESVRHLPLTNAISSMVALKQANYVCDQEDDCQAYILYDSMLVQGIYERYYKAAQDRTGIMMSKAEISSISQSEDGKLNVVATDTLLGGAVELNVDMVVLPTGMVPSTAKEPILWFDYRQGPAFPDLDLFDGYADSNYICFPYETRRTGVYAAGCVRQPMMLDQAEEDAIGATMKAIQCIESANRGVAVHPRSGDLSYPIFNFVRCTQCKRCTEECPFGALDDDEKGTPKPNYSRCRRCGTCMGACPERVISFSNYNIDMVGSMIREVVVPDDMDAGGPRVIILACENDAYPALDMAALRGHSWSPYVRIIPVRCLGSVNAIWVADAMSKGIDGVMLLGCKYGDDYQCHFVKGSEICNRRKENIAETLNRLGVQPERVEQYQIAIDEYDKLPGMINSFMNMLLEMGPNPFKGY